LITRVVRTVEHVQSHIDEPFEKPADEMPERRSRDNRTLVLPSWPKIPTVEAAGIEPASAAAPN